MATSQSDRRSAQPPRAFVSPGGSVRPGHRAAVTPERGENAEPQSEVSLGTTELGREPPAPGTVVRRHTVLSDSAAATSQIPVECECVEEGCDCDPRSVRWAPRPAGSPLFAVTVASHLFDLLPGVPVLSVGATARFSAALPPKWPPPAPPGPPKPHDEKKFPPVDQPPLYKPGKGQPPDPPGFDNELFYIQILDRLPPPPPDCVPKVELLGVTTELIEWTKLKWTAWLNGGDVYIEPITNSGLDFWSGWVDVYACELVSWKMHFRIHYDGSKCPPDEYYSVSVGSTLESCKYLRTDDISGTLVAIPAPNSPDHGEVVTIFKQEHVEAELKKKYGKDTEIQKRSGIVKQQPGSK